MTDREIDKEGGRPASSTYAGYQQKPEPTRSAGAAAENAPAAGAGTTDASRPQIDLRQKAKDDLASVKTVAKDEISNAYHGAEEVAERQKGFAADRISGIAKAMTTAGAELEGQQQPEVGRLTRQMGESVARFADDIKDRDLREIAGMAEDFGRRQPLAFLGLAAMAGLVASRFVGASASRQTSGVSATAGNPDVRDGKPAVRNEQSQTADAESGIRPPTPADTFPATAVTPATGGSNV